ncbi:MAG TPA: hypothetical protein VF101_09360 [Gaiellaceae bacterium]
MTVGPSAVRSREEPPASMIDRLASFRAIPTFFIGLLAVVEVVIVFATHVSAVWLVPAVAVSGVGILAFFGSRVAWRLWR